MDATFRETLRQIGDLFLHLADTIEPDHGNACLSADGGEHRPRKNLPERNDDLPNVRLKWRDEDIRKLLSLHELGVDRTEIARVLGRTPGAIHDRLFHHEWGLLRNEDA